tara:strand:- start:958 stop:1776 length:819 start_codon:yes stop_codon:yes gene_type:complete
MKTKLLIFIILLIYLFTKKPFKIETYSSIHNINKSYTIIKEPIRSDQLIGYIHNISPMRSEYIYNYLFNLNSYSPIYLLPGLTLDQYINKICFIDNYKNGWNNNFSYNLIDGIMDITNNILKNYFKSDTLFEKTIYIFEYIKLLKNIMKDHLKVNIKKNVNYELYYLSNNFIFDRLVDILIENQDSSLSLNNIVDFIVNDLDEKKLVKLLTKKDYDNIDILFEGIDETLVNFINDRYRKDYSTILNLSLYEVKNLYFTGELIDYDFKDKYCK